MPKQNWQSLEQALNDYIKEWEKASTLFTQIHTLLSE